MSLEERKALREKHIRIEMPKPFYGGCATCLCYTLSETPELVNAPWPCDVIKELDASENADISCDTKQTEERKFSDLETKVEQSEISASATSDELPTDECDHITKPSSTVARIVAMGETCPKCGEKL